MVEGHGGRYGRSAKWTVFPSSRLPVFPSSRLPVLAGGTPHLPVEPPTALDRIFTDAILATAAHSLGSLPFEQIRSAIEEWVRLDGNRHRNWFHVGFLDELEWRGGSLERAPLNEPSRGWYVAGVVLALADRGRRVAIADLFDQSRDDLTRLLDDTHEACGHAALAIFEALCEMGRRADALAIVAPAAVCRGGAKFLDFLVYESRDVAARASSAEIAAFAALLDGVVKALEQAGSTIPPEFLRESALLCAREHRRRGEFELAASLLDRIESSTPASFQERERIERGFIA